MEKLLTIVIPTYNMEELLDRCLSSLIINNKILFEQLEVLVVIDGAKDNSSQIAHRYQDKYPNTFRVIDKENGNYGSCLNRGFNEAQGLYTRTLDADDWFFTKALEDFMTKLNNLQEYPDLIITNYSLEKGGSSKTVICNYETNHSVHLVGKDFLPEGIVYSIHTATYKTEILRNINLDEKISYTDVEVNYLTIDKIKTYLLFTDIVLYRYFIGREGQTVSLSSYIKNIQHVETVLNRFLSENKSLTEKDTFIHKIRTTLPLISIYYKLNIARKTKDQEYANFLDFHKKVTTIPALKRSVFSIKYAKIHYVKIWNVIPFAFSPLFKILYGLKER